MSKSTEEYWAKRAVEIIETPRKPNSFWDSRIWTDKMYLLRCGSVLVFIVLSVMRFIIIYTGIPFF